MVDECVAKIADPQRFFFDEKRKLFYLKGRLGKLKEC
jgi:hypothetical protein